MVPHDAFKIHVSIDFLAHVVLHYLGFHSLCSLSVQLVHHSICLVQHLSNIHCFQTLLVLVRTMSLLSKLDEISGWEAGPRVMTVYTLKTFTFIKHQSCKRGKCCNLFQYARERNLQADVKGVYYAILKSNYVIVHIIYDSKQNNTYHVGMTCKC